MSGSDHLNPDQFLQRRAEQLKDDGLSLIRQPKPKPGTIEASKAAHPAGKKRRPRLLKGEKE